MTDDKWTKAREHHIETVDLCCGTSDILIASSRAADFGRQYERDLILSSPEMRGLVEEMAQTEKGMETESYDPTDGAMDRAFECLAAFKARFPEGGE